MEKTAFEKVPNGRSGSMLAWLDGVKIRDLEAAFGPTNDDAYWDDEAGYDGIEYTFKRVSDGAVFAVYTRYGSPRIGGFGDLNDVADFIEWLKISGLPDAAMDPLDLKLYMNIMSAHADINAMINEDKSS